MAQARERLDMPAAVMVYRGLIRVVVRDRRVIEPASAPVAPETWGG